MQKLLADFIQDASSRGIYFSNSELKNIKISSREKKIAFYNEFLDLYSKFLKTILIPSDTTSFYVHNDYKNCLIVTFFDSDGKKIKNLTFRNIKKADLEKFLFKQLIGGDTN